MIQAQDTNKNDICTENLDSQLPPPKVSSLPLIEGKKEDDSLIGCDYQVLKSNDHQPLQDLCATKSEGMLKEDSQEFEEKIPEIKTMFGSLLEQIWSGEWSSLRPTQFKDTLEIFHPQFRGAHQQDCQVHEIFKFITRQRKNYDYKSYDSKTKRFVLFCRNFLHYFLTLFMKSFELSENLHNQTYLIKVILVKNQMI